MIHLPPCSLCPRLPYRRPIHPDGPIPCQREQDTVLMGIALAVDSEEVKERLDKLKK